MFLNPFGLEAKRRRLLQKAPPGPLREFLETPFPSSRSPITGTPLLAVDFETSGLDPRRDHLLSVGHVQVSEGRVELRTAGHWIVRSSRELAGENVAIHQITDDQLATGLPLEEVMASLLRELAGKVLLAHHAAVELGFLREICTKLYGMAPVVPVIDTLQVAKRSFDRQDKPYQGGELRLFNLREDQGLPAYRPHNALCDAIATAELFLVQVAGSYSRKPPPLRNFLLRT